jgi:hypothetical protein
MALGRLENGNQTDTSANDGFGWRCANQRCPTRRTIRAGSFFERSLITLDKWLYVTYLWSQGTNKPKTHCSLLARRPLLYFDL